MHQPPQGRNRTVAARAVPLGAALVLLMASGCASVSGRNPVFVNPASFVGETVQVCGWFDGPNILENRDDWAHGGGVSIIDRGPLDQRFEGRACVEGTLEFMGCETQVCTDAAFEYAIRITRLLEG